MHDLGRHHRPDKHRRMDEQTSTEPQDRGYAGGVALNTERNGGKTGEFKNREAWSAPNDKLSGLRNQNWPSAAHQSTFEAFGARFEDEPAARVG